MPAPLTAYIDMEFAGIYGTRQLMQIPIEIGVVLHDPGTDSLSFAGKPFSYDIDVELWKNITDDVGKRVDGKRRVFNLAEPGLTREYNRRLILLSSMLLPSWSMSAWLIWPWRLYAYVVRSTTVPVSLSPWRTVFFVCWVPLPPKDGEVVAPGPYS